MGLDEKNLAYGGKTGKKGKERKNNGKVIVMTDTTLKARENKFCKNKIRNNGREGRG